MPINQLTAEGFGMLSGVASASFTGLLDEYPNAAAAYSVRRLSSTYEGALMQVRIDTVGQPVYDIGFDANGDLDTADLISKAAGNDAFVRTWYDQSGNANNAQQTTTANQPQIVNSGSVILENNKPCIFYSNDNLVAWENVTAPTLFQNMSDEISILLVEKSTVISNNSTIWFNGNTIIELRENSSSSGTGVPFNIGYSNSNFGFGVSDNYTIGSEIEFSSGITSIQRLSTSFVNGDDLNVYLNSSSAINTTFTNAIGDRSVGNGNSTLSIGSRSRDVGVADSNYFSGTMQEVILYKSNKLSSRTGIESNINSYYSIYSPSSGIGTWAIGTTFVIQ
jgi:hypothetical protein